MKKKYPNPTISFVIEFKGKFLLILRKSKEKNFPGLWAFTGGKVEFGETVVDTIRREVAEETGLEIFDKCAFLDTYQFGKSVGLTFLVRAKSDKLKLSDAFSAYQWIVSYSDMKKLRCVPGIYNHLKQAKQALNKGKFDSLEQLNLTEEKYINKN